MTFFYSFPSELVRLALQDNSVCLEYPRDRLFSSVLIFYFASSCLFVLASFAFRGQGVQLLVIHLDIVVFVVLQLLLLQKGLQWAQCFLGMAESTFAMTDTVRRDSIRRRSQESFARHDSSRYENSALRRDGGSGSSGSAGVRKRTDDSEPHSIDIDMSKLNSAIQKGTLFG